MNARKCCVDKCHSSSERERDRGVTFHRLPKNPEIRDRWSEQACLDGNVDVKSCFVCSRHFRKVDFEPYKCSKFGLKSDAVPTIFPWGVTQSKELRNASSEDRKDPNLNDKDAALNDRKSENVRADANMSIKTDGENCANDATSRDRIDEECGDRIVTYTEHFEEFLKEKRDVVVSEFKRKRKNSDASSESDSESKPLICLRSERNGTKTIEDASPRRTTTAAPEIESAFENLSEKERVDSKSTEERPEKIGDTQNAIKGGAINDFSLEKLNNLPPAPPQKRKLPVGRPRRRSPFRNKQINSKTRFTKRKKINTIEKNFVSKVTNVSPSKEPAVYTVGMRVEAKGFNDIWYPAKVLEVDHYEQEVLIHYDNWSQRFDEWISEHSTRLRPIPGPPATCNIPTTYTVGERCYARWSNNQKFPATVNKVLQNGKYEVKFDDGFTRTMKWIMMSKGISRKILSEPTSPTNPNVCNEIADEAKDIPVVYPPQTIHRHLFDPNRDHLGTKEERRHMKKRIDVKSLFFARKKKKEAAAGVNNGAMMEEKEDRRKRKKLRIVDPILTEKVKKKRGRKKRIEQILPENSMPDMETTTTPTLSLSVTIEPMKKDESQLNNNVSVLSPKESTNLTIETKNLETSPVLQQTPPPLRSPPTEKAPMPDEILNPSPPTHSLLSEILHSAPRSPHVNNIGLKPASPILPATPLMKDNNIVKAAEKDWCCHWIDGQPVGNVIEEVEPIKDTSVNRITIKVEDPRIPPGWVKLLTRKTICSTDGKWDVVLVCPSGRRYRTRGEMLERLKESDHAELAQYTKGLMDFSAHRKQARRRGWDVLTPNTMYNSNIKTELSGNEQTLMNVSNPSGVSNPLAVNHDNCVYIGSLRVQIIENLLRCPQEGCFKNFRKENLLQMHIKHYHRELCKFFGDTPNVADLAYARTIVEEPQTPPSKPKVDVDKNSSKTKERKLPIITIKTEGGTSSIKVENVNFNDYYPINNQERAKNPYAYPNDSLYEDDLPGIKEEISMDEVKMNNIDDQYQMFGNFKKVSKKRHSDSLDENKSKKKKIHNSYDSWNNISMEYDETRSSFGIIDKNNEMINSSDVNPDQLKDIKNEKEDSEQSVIITETGEKITIVHMKKEEIINCHCGFGEEDGLMIQCELCLCWQHAICHQIEKESQVPEKYICSICLNPPRGRSSQKYLHEQDWIYEGKLPRFSPTPKPVDQLRQSLLRKSHELAANLTQLRVLMHSLRCKLDVAEKKDHPKLYLWAKPWDDNVEVAKDPEPHKTNDILTPEKEVNFKTTECLPNTEKESKSDEDNVKETTTTTEIPNENLEHPIKEETTLSQENKSQTNSDILKDPKADLVNGTLFTNLLSSPGGTAIDLPITSSELETLTKAVQIAVAPQPEAAIEPAECRIRLLQHIERTQLLLEARLDTIEAQIAELELQDVPLDDDDTPDNCPKTKQTITMLLRDLQTLQKLGLS